MIGEKLKGWFASSSRFVAASAQLAKKQAELATLNNVTLPRLYHAIGKRIIDSPNLPPDLVPYREKIRELEAAIAAKPEEPKSEPASGFAAKAKQLAQQAASKTAKATADAGASIKIQSAYVALGKQAIENHDLQELPQELRERYEAAQQRRATLAGEIGLGAAPRRSRRFSRYRLGLLGGLGCCVVAFFGVRVVTGWIGGGASQQRRVVAFEPDSKSSPSNPKGLRSASATRQFQGADAVVAAVLGKTSDHYTKPGYKDVVLGSTFDQISSSRTLGGLDLIESLGMLTTDDPCVFRDQSGTPDAFWFDESNRLVAYSYTYKGGARDYQKELEAVFGRPDTDSVRLESHSSRAASRTIVQRHTFPKTVVLISFDRVVNMFSVEEYVDVFVLDRQYLERVLQAVAAMRQRACEWVKASTICLKTEDVRVEKCPVFDGCRVEPHQLEIAGVAMFEEGTSGDADDPLIGVVRLGSTALVNHEPLVEFNFAALAGANVGPKLRRRDGAGSDSGLAFACNYLPFMRMLKGELTFLLLHDYFPSPDGTYRLVGGWRYKWEHTDGSGDRWDITSSADVMTVVYKPKKRL